MKSQGWPCDVCGLPAFCVQTNLQTEGVRRRTYSCSHGHRTQTREISKAVYEYQKSWLQDRIKMNVRGVEKRKKEFAMRERVADLLATNPKAKLIWIAAEAGCSKRLVSSVKALAQKQSPAHTVHTGAVPVLSSKD